MRHARTRRIVRLVSLLVSFAVAAACTARAQTTGLVPLNDLGAGTYAGFAGGLYPGGANTPPAGHLAAALARAARVVPRDGAGQPDPDGWIGMIAVGMSNTTHEFGAFERNADADTTRNARVVLMDTGFGGQTATVLANPAATYWTTMSQRISAMGLTAAQVQVAWLKEAEFTPPNNFPLHAQALRDTLKRVVQNLHERYPNLAICYVSSRIYGGYSPPTSINPEPQSYESGFAVKWLIEDQINGDPSINFDPAAGAVRAPLLLWGPYLWADGTNARSDGLAWLIGDLENDHIHPSPAGEQKVARLLAAFFGSDPTTTSWWPRQADARLQVLDAIHDSYVSAAAPSANFGAETLLVCAGGTSPLRSYVRFDAGAVAGPVRLAKLSLRVNQTGNGTLRRVDDASWDESTITYATAPASPATIAPIPSASRDGTVGLDVTPTVLASTTGQLSFALGTTSASADYHSKEGGQPPRLVMVVATSTVAAPAAGPPHAARLRTVGPNPVLSRARITFELPTAQRVDLAVFAVDGRRVLTLASGTWAAGPHELAWEGRDAAGSGVPAGIYMIRLATRGEAEARKVVWLGR